MRNRELDRPTAGFGFSRALGLMLNYFIGHLLVYRILIARVVRAVDPSAIVYPIWALYMWYGCTLILSLYFAWPLLVESWEVLRMNIKRTFKITLSIFPVMYLFSIAFSVMITTISGQSTSINQTNLNQLLGQFPAITIVLTVVFAPIVEELVFRGGFYRYFRAKGMFWFPLILSACAFSLIHVGTAISAGHFQDLWFFPLYAGLGMFLSLAYEKTGNIYGSILLHFTYNAVGMLIALIAR